MPEKGGASRLDSFERIVVLEILKPLKDVLKCSWFEVGQDLRELLFISEHSAYGLLTGPSGRMFHTSDVPLVDALVSKLQNLYDLQPL